MEISILPRIMGRTNPKQPLSQTEVSPLLTLNQYQRDTERLMLNLFLRRRLFFSLQQNIGLYSMARPVRTSIGFGVVVLRVLIVTARRRQRQIGQHLGRGQHFREILAFTSISARALVRFLGFT